MLSSPQEDIAKKIRNVQKKLRQITELKEVKELSAEQTRKLKTEPLLLEQLQELNNEHARALAAGAGASSAGAPSERNGGEAVAAPPTSEAPSGAAPSGEEPSS
eukprot:877811-Prymnesium_polylepis.1